MWQALVLISILILVMGFTPRILGSYFKKIVVQNNPEDIHLANSFAYEVVGNHKQADIEAEKHVDVCIQRMLEDFKKSHPNLQK